MDVQGVLDDLVAEQQALDAIDAAIKAKQRLMIGVVNLVVSFLLALNVAMRARQVRAARLWDIGGAFLSEVRSRPGLLFFPPPIAEEVEASERP